MYDLDRMGATRGYFYTDPKEAAVRAIQEQFGEIEIPYKIEVCPGCRGEGAIPFGEHIAFTASEFYETFDDAESRQEYFDGGYDKECPDCKGRNVVRVVDEERFKEENAEAYKVFHKTWKECVSYNEESLAEYRAGC